MRKLVTVQKVKDLVAIDGADKIELCLIQGWQVVVQKGIHAVGDLVLFYEIDSFLPAEDPRYASFSARFHNWGDKHGMRVKTIKLRKQLSQGLVMPLREFPELYTKKIEGTLSVVNGLHYEKSTMFNHEEGDDVTEILSIEKWEPIEKEQAQHMAGSSTGKKFPAFIRKTDQERIQNYGTLVERALDEEFEATVKKDGSSLTVFRVDPKSIYYKDAKALTSKKLSLLSRFLNLFKKQEAVYGICSRNILLKLEGDTNFHKVVAKYNCLACWKSLVVALLCKVSWLPRIFRTTTKRLKMLSSICLISLISKHRTTCFHWYVGTMLKLSIFRKPQC